MANAQVILKLTPHELQIVSAALKMYAYANKHLNREGYKHPLEGYQHDLTLSEGDPRKAAMAAQGIRQYIGLK